MTEVRIRASIEQTKLLSLGGHSSYGFAQDPKHLVFTLARYKFVSKMLEGFQSVLEVGCGDGFGASIVAQAVERLLCIDSEAFQLDRLAENPWLDRNATFRVHDILQGPVSESFQAAYSLDVIEHIPPEREGNFLRNMVDSCEEHGVLIVGTPNVTAAQYAAQNSRIGHINLKSHKSLKQTLGQYYRHVFVFGMNDEVVHTGYADMCHYLIGLATDPR